MCGIVGYLGSEHDPKDVILAGLEKLEYRGYDSAGMAVFNGNQIERIRAQGKLIYLKNKVQDKKFTGPAGIGHTRWATHGKPSESNAHPHQAGVIHLVHNGIIENDDHIRKQLKAEGVTLTSDTDSELVAHLINRAYAVHKDLFLAVKSVLPSLKGAFSIVVICQDNPQELVAFKDGPPLIIGIGQGETFIVSDVAASLQYTDKYIYLDDREIVKVTPQGVKIFSQAGIELRKEINQISWSADVVEKRGFSHFMLKEIHEQAQSVAQALEPHLNEQRTGITLAHQLDGLHFLNHNNQPEIVFEKALNDIDRVIIVACGTSYYAGLVGQYMIEKFSKTPCSVEVASEFRYRDPVVSKNTLFISISQSGETADTLAAIRLAKSKGVKTLSICNVKNSSIDREADIHLYMNCGPEIGVASTKAFTSTLTVLSVFCIEFSKAKKQLDLKSEQQWVEGLLALPSQIEVVLAYDKYFSDASDALKKYHGFLFMGRGVMYPIALEGALKMKELTYLHAEGYPAGEMKHGPLALIDEDMAVVMLAPRDELYEKTVSNLQEVKARGAKIISLGSGDDENLKSLSDRYLAIPKVSSWVDPILAVIPLQLMAFHLAQSLGYDVDQPRNLAKSVTVE